MERFMAVFGAIALGTTNAAAGVPVATAPSVVVELFTSQGCASCPPADALLSALADRDDVVSLSFHVDYWDRLGWADPFSLHVSTERQYAYAAAWNSTEVYTPQVVVNGRTGVVGSRPDAVAQAMTDGVGGLTVPVGLSVSDGRVSIDAPGLPHGAMVWLVAFQDGQETRVLRGENAGETIVNRHNVLALLPIELDGNGTAIVPAPVGDGVAALVQTGDGTILGAAQAPLQATPQ